MKCKKWLALLLAVVMVVAFTACGKDGGDDTVVAKIEDTSITAAELNEFLALSANMAGQDLSAFESQPELLNMLRQNMLRNLVSFEAMRMSLEAKGGEIFPEDYQEKLDEFLKAKKDAGVSEATLTRYFNLAYYSEPFNKEASDAVSDEEVQAYYNEHKDDLYTAAAASGEVSHILVDSEDKANEIYDKIMAGADFAEMAKEYGTDGTKDTGGSLGVLSEDDANYDADFMKGAFALKSGEVSKPVKSQFGYHLIKMDNRQEAGGVKPFDDVKDSIREELVAQKYNEVVTKLVDNYKVEYFGDFAENNGTGDDGGADNSGDGADGGSDAE